MEPDNVTPNDSPRPRRRVVQENARSNSHPNITVDQNVNVSTQRHYVQPPIIMGVGGASRSGKTQACERIKKALSATRRSCTIISLEWFYNGKPVNNRNSDEPSYNFDHPDAFDFGLLREKLHNLAEGISCFVTRYDFNRRIWFNETLQAADVIILDGILALHKSLLEELHVKVFVERAPDLCLVERIRKYGRKGISSQWVLMQYERSVRPGYLDFIRPTREYADLIIPGDGNEVAVKLIKSYLGLREDVFSGQTRRGYLE